MLRIFANFLIMHTLYMCVSSFIFAMWDFVSCFKFAGDVAMRGASDRGIKS